MQACDVFRCFQSNMSGFSQLDVEPRPMCVVSLAEERNHGWVDAVCTAPFFLGPGSRGCPHQQHLLWKHDSNVTLVVYASTGINNQPSCKWQVCRRYGKFAQWRRGAPNHVVIGSTDQAANNFHVLDLRLLLVGLSDEQGTIHPKSSNTHQWQLQHVHQEWWDHLRCTDPTPQSLKKQPSNARSIIPHHLMFFFPPWYPCLWGPLIFVTTPSDSGSQPLEHCSQHIGPEMGGTQRRVGIAFHIDVVPMRFLGWFMIDRRDLDFRNKDLSILYLSVSIFFPHILSYRESTQVSFSALRYWRAFTAEGENCWLVWCQS